MGTASSSERSKWGAADFAAVEDWPGYFSVIAGKPPRETLLDALKRFEADGPARFPRLAVDLGAGEGRDTAELLRRGWRVAAIDSHAESMTRIWARPDLVNTDRLTTTRASFEACLLPACDLLNASYALPFCSPPAFGEVWSRIGAAVRPGGRFAGQFFGDRDTWAAIPGRSHHTEAQARAFLDGWEVEHFQVEENDKPDSLGRNKHWHIMHVVARKPATESPRKQP